MIIALIGFTENSKPSILVARQAARFIAAAGHSLLICPETHQMANTALAYKEAEGVQLIGIFPEERFSSEATAIFDETIPHVPEKNIADQIDQTSDAILFLSPPEPAQGWTSQFIENSEKLVYILTEESKRGVPTNPGKNVHILSTIEEFARELAKNFSRTIVSIPDPMKERLRRMEEGFE